MSTSLKDAQADLSLSVGTQIRTSDSLNEGLPIKMVNKSFKENAIFYILPLELYAQMFFALDQYLLNNMGRKHCFCYSTYRK